MPHSRRLQVDYATGELERLRVLGPIDTKLFIGQISEHFSTCCRALVRGALSVV